MKSLNVTANFPDRARREGRLRPVDLARAVGVSTQQVRNYEERGILPPAPRTASGYRVYSRRHLHALLTFRALLQGCTPGVAENVMHAAHADDRGGVLALMDGEHSALHEQRRALEETRTALQALAEAQQEHLAVDRPLRIGELAGLLGVRTSALRVWEAEGLVLPERERGTGYRSYAPVDVRDARIVHTLRQSRYLLPQIGRVLAELRHSGGTTELRRAIDQRQAELARRSAALLVAGGRLHAYLEGADSTDP